MNTSNSGTQRSISPWRNFFDMNNFFRNDWPGFERESLPAVNISEDDKCYMVDVVSPGFSKGDFKVKVDDDVLTISAESKHESADEKKDYSRREYSYSSFTRSFRLPDNAKDDEINAEYKDGVLQLVIPKTKQQVKTSKEISVK